MCISHSSNHAHLPDVSEFKPITMKYLQHFSFSLSLIALMTLPWFLMSHTMKEVKPSKMYSLPILFQSKGHCCGDRGCCYGIPKAYEEYLITEDGNRNGAIFSEIRADLKMLLKTGNTRRILKIKVSDSTLFEDYITCLSIFKEKEHIIFAPTTDCIYAAYTDRVLNQPSKPSGEYPVMEIKAPFMFEAPPMFIE
jgi:hypothetical protein